MPLIGLPSPGFEVASRGYIDDRNEDVHSTLASNLRIAITWGMLLRYFHDVRLCEMFESSCHQPNGEHCQQESHVLAKMISIIHFHQCLPLDARSTVLDSDCRIIQED